MNLKPYLKAVVAVVAAVAVVLQAALTDGSISPAEWWTIAFAALGALGVYGVPNLPLVGNLLDGLSAGFQAAPNKIVEPPASGAPATPPVPPTP